MQYKVSNVEKMIGVFVFICLLFIGGFVVLNIKEGKLFSKRIKLITIVDKGYGFTEGSVVKVNGINAGTVEDIRLDDYNKVWITMSLPREFAYNIHNDAVVEIIEPLALGSPEINILPGSKDKPLVQNKEILPVHTSDGLAAKVEKSFTKIEKVIEDIHQSMGPLKETIENINKITKNIESITAKIDKGDGSLGQMVNDKQLYNSAKDAVDSTRTIVEGIKSTKIYVGGDSDYYIGQDVAISKLHLRVVPRETRYFWLGGAIFNPTSDSKITIKRGDLNYKIVPEAIIAQKIFDQRLIIRGGLMEGKFGGALDYVPIPEIGESLLLSIEVRDTFDDDDFNENIDTFLVRVKAKVKLLKYFSLEVGGDNLMDDAGFFAGIGFEYMDEDISKIVGLIGAGK
ncbi:MAG: MCE family protein [Planctomycetes bacterium]|nr:MCE family protein [Planctomycetota bacterium]